MNIIKIKYTSEIPENYTGIVEYSNGTKVWYLNGKTHRLDGPAIEYPSGTKYWYLNDVYYPQEEWFERLSEEDKEKAIWNLR
jgi:hypothetical protein